MAPISIPNGIEIFKSLTKKLIPRLAIIAVFAAKGVAPLQKISKIPGY